jgi:hypothetical protein
MACLRTVLRFEGALVNCERRLLKPWALPLPALVRAPVIPPRSQRRTPVGQALLPHLACERCSRFCASRYGPVCQSRCSTPWRPNRHRELALELFDIVANRNTARPPVGRYPREKSAASTVA